MSYLKKLKGIITFSVLITITEIVEHKKELVKQLQCLLTVEELKNNVQILKSIIIKEFLKRIMLNLIVLKFKTLLILMIYQLNP